jgi:Ni,Fe-hydrogenase III large subunit
MLRTRTATPVPRWAAEVFRLYQHYRETGALPDNRGLDYNNAWLIEAFEALMEVEGKFLNAMVSGIEVAGGVPTRKWRRDELPQAHEQAVKAAQRLAELVERIKAEQDGSSPDLNPIS